MKKPNSNREPEPTAIGSSLPLFDDQTPPSLERALAIVGRVPLDATFRRDLINGHGPYWYASFTRAGGGKTVRLYVGSDERMRVIENAHEMVRAELERVGAKADAEIAKADAEIERVQRSPDLVLFRRLQAAAFARPAREQGRTVDVPTFDPLKKTSAPHPKERRAPTRRARQGS